MKAFITLAAALLLIMSAHTLAFKQDQYAIEVSPASPRLSQQSVGQIFQDKNGFIWLLTQEGLNRYDGYDVTTFSAVRGDATSLSHQYTTDIAEDENGALWISTLGGGLNLFDSAQLTFDHYTADSTINRNKPLSNFVTEIHESKSGGLWVGYAGGRGFSYLDVEAKVFEHFFLPAQGTDSRVSGFFEHTDGTVFISVTDEGVFLKQADTNETTPLSDALSKSSVTPPSNVSDLVHLPSKKLLITSYTEGAFQLDLTTMQLERHALHSATESDTADEIYAAFVDREENIWFGTNAGIVVYSRLSDVTWITTENSNLPDDQVISIFQSDVGMMWIGTYSGLAQGTRTLFQKLTEDDGIPNNAIFSFGSDDEDRWWVGTDAGVARFETTVNRDGEITLRGNSEVLLRDYTIMSIAVMKERVFAGTLDSGLFEINTLDKTITHHKAGVESGSLSFGGVPVLRPLDEQRLLVGTYGGGLNIFDLRQQSFSVLRNDPRDKSSISDDRIISLMIDSEKRIWVGTADGLNLFTPSSQTFRQFAYDQLDEATISSNVILSLAEDRNGDIWIGTRSGGLNLLKREDIDTPTPAFTQPLSGAGVPSADIYGVIVDTMNRLWLSHNAGLSLINSDRTNVQNFDETSGLQGPEFNHGAAHITSAGILLFGGQNGFNSFQANQDFQISYEPQLLVTSFKLLNERVFFDTPYSSLDEIRLSYDYQFASLEFTALDYRRPSNILYRYRIDGIHDEWIDLGRNRQVSISGLGYGNYKIRLSATNSDRVWIENEKSLSLYIAPPIWMRWYAFALYAALVIYITFLFIQRQNAKTKREQGRRHELEKRVRERTADLQIARNQAEAAAKAKANFLAAMSHEIRTPMHGMIGMTDLLLQSGLTRQQENFAVTARDSGQSLLEIVNSILDYSKLEASKLQLSNDTFDCRKLIENVASLLSQNATSRDTRLLISWSSCDRRNLHGDAGKIRQVVINLVGNAVKFTQGGTVMIRCCVSKRSSEPLGQDGKYSLKIRVIDTGIGIAREKLESIFDVFTQADVSTTRQYGGTGLGLSISKELTQLMGGTLSVSSEPNVGSEFVFETPISPGDEDNEVVDLGNRHAYCVTSDDNVADSIISRLALSKAIVSRVNSFSEIALPTSEPVVIFVDEDEFPSSAVDSFSGTAAVFLLRSISETEAPVQPEFTIMPPYRESDLLSAFGNEHLEVNTKKILGEHLAEILDADKNFAARVLVVEDVEVNQRIADSMLRALGFQTDIASNGREGVELSKSGRYDAIFMDCQMPVLDGYAATAEIRKYEKETGSTSTPIIALTAGGDNAEESQIFQVGMDKLVRKPFTMSDLRSTFSHFGISLPNPSDQFEREPARKTNLEDSLDLDVLNGLSELAASGGNDALMSQLLEGYAEQFDEKIEELSAVIEKREIADIKKLAHAIKSMSANMGAKLVRGIAENIEVAGDQYDTSCASRDIENMRKHKDAFYIAYKKRFQLP